jgi:hypothetical protein
LLSHLLKASLPCLLVLFAKNRCVHTILRITKFSLHSVPVFDQLQLCSASHMVRFWAVLIVTLNYTTLFSVAIIARDAFSQFINYATNFSLCLILKPYLRCPIHANDMRPLFFLSINWFNYSVKIRTQNTFNFFWVLLLFDNNFASCTVPRLIFPR